MTPDRVIPLIQQRPLLTPAHSFRSLLDELGTVVSNTMQVEDSGERFQLKTRLTPLQQRVLELLEITL